MKKIICILTLAGIVLSPLALTQAQAADSRSAKASFSKTGKHHHGHHKHHKKH